MAIRSKAFKRTFYLTTLFVLLSSLTISISTVYAIGILTLGTTVVGNPASVQTGETVEYIIDFSCGSLGGDCGNLEINFQLDSELGFLEVIAPPGYYAEENPANSGNIYIRTDPIGRVFDDGEAGQVTVRAVVTQDLDDFVLEGTVTGQIANGPSGGTQTVIIDGPNVPIETPDGGWTTDKQRTSPGGNLGPIENGSASYDVSACPQTGAFGIARLDSITIQDTFPAGAVPQLPIPNGGVVSGNTITWTFNYAAPNYYTTDDGCITVNYTLDYPTPGFTYGSDITNTYVITATTPDVDFPDPGVCGVPDCLGAGSDPGTIDPPSVTIGAGKAGPGINAIVGPGNSNGFSTFDLSWNLNNANTGTSNFIFADVFPTAIDGDPIIEVTSFTSGTWSGGYPALVQISTVQNPNPANNADWITIDTTTGGANTYTNGVTANYPATGTDLITGVRWDFTGSTVPAGFSSSGIQLQFFVRAGMDPADYDQDGGGPLIYHDYDNCLYRSGNYQDQLNATQPATTGNVCDTLRIGEDTTDGFANIIASKSSSPTAIFPLQNIQFTLEIDLTQEASGDLINPAIQDILPYGMQIVSWDSVTLPSGITNVPYLAVDTVAGLHPVTNAATTLQRLRFYWDDTAILPNSYQCGAFPCTMDTNISTFALDGVTATTPPVGFNGIAVPPPDTGAQILQIRFTAQARVDTPATDDNGATVPYSNTITTVSDSTNLVCQSGNSVTDSGDADGDGNTTEVACNTSSNYQVREAAQMNSQKWIRNTDAIASFDFLAFNDLDAPPPATCPTYSFGGDTFTRYPCVAQGLPGSQFEYLLRVINTGLVDTDEYIMYDILPHEPDFGVSEALGTSPRETEFRVFLTELITYENPLIRANAPTFTIEYYEEAGIPAFNPCRPQMSLDFNEAYNPAGCGGGTWTTTPTFDAVSGTYPEVTAFRIVQSNSGTGYIARGEQLIFTVPMEIDDAPGEAETGEISWNTFAQRFTNAQSDARLLTAEPRKVGIVVEPRYSVGNRVWIDDGAGGGIAANGIIDGTEIGINGVEVHLYQDTGTGFALYAIDETRTDANTGENGFYFFGNLPGGDNIAYQVRIPASEFVAGQPLADYISSYGEAQSASPNNGFDEYDNGIDPTVIDDYGAGISSASFNLTDDDEFAGELTNNTNTDGNLFAPIGGSPNDPTDESTTGRGETYESDTNSDLTVDMGFFKPMSLGNRIWLDDGAGGGTVNNGIIDGTEAGIPGVILRLYAGNGTTPINNPETGAPYQVTTDAQGYYLFDLLPPGQYVVRVMPENFQFGITPADPDGPLADYISSDTTGIAGTPAENPVDENGVEYFAGVDEEDDRTDHGIDPAVDGTQRTLGVYSAVITLTTDSETTSELPGDKSAAVDGRRSTNNNSDLTVDFGFFQESATNFSLGNFVWNDVNNDGIYDPDGLDNIAATADDETGIPNVEMTLWSVNAGGNPLAALATTTTDAQGYYVFANLDPGRYIVQMTARNWQGVGGLADLSEYISSTGSTGDTELDSDVNENGVDPVDGNANNTVADEYIANGVFSTPILLEPQGEPLAEPSNQPNPGLGSGNSDDDNSDLTIDFGVFRPMSIGNIVWLDSGITGAGVVLAQYNDGIRNGTEPGIANVVVQLYRDTDGDGTPETLYATDTTDANGYYLFDTLPPGNYRVDVTTGNFTTGQPLLNLVSSLDVVAPLDADLDDDDHGIDVADPTANPVSSPVIVLVYDSEPLQTDTVAAGGDPNNSNNPLDGPQFRGNNGESDANSDRTVDFGFVAPPMSIGNRVFFDSGDNGTNPTQFDDGLQNGTEPGIDGVTVNLYQDNNSDGAPDGPAIRTVVTAGGGYYLFDNLPPGNYLVGIPATNFDADGADNIPGNADDGVLASYVSSTDVIAPLDGDPDADDHGINPATAGNEVLSPTINLATASEPSAGNAPDDSEIVTGTGLGNTIADNNSDLTVDFGFIRPMSIGNRVWLDIDRTTGTLGDGIRQGNETGIAGVTLELYLDNGTTPGVLDAGDTLIAQTTTTNTGNPVQDGYYLFDETTTVTAPGVDDPNNSPIGPGDYLVHIPASNFAPTNVLEGLINSDGPNGAGTDNQVDSDTGDENGVNAVPGNAATYPVTAGVTSTTIGLRFDAEPVIATETDRDPNQPVTSINGVNVQDNNGDFTVDFGFYNALAIGNRVWFDGNRNGLIDGTDDNPAVGGINPGIPGVTVYLYEDFNADGVPDGAFIANDVTDVDGYYLFDQTGDQSILNGGNLLIPGNYIVGIDPTAGANGALLVNHVNTITIVGGQGNDADIDSDDNGIDRRDVFPAAPPTIIYSESINLASFTESITEVGKETGIGDGRYNIQNHSSNLTVDFGFFVPMSIGNRVWLDSNNDGLLIPGDPLEPGIDGVIVELFRDNGAGINPATDVPYRTTITNSDVAGGGTEMGYYIFDDLPPGNYVVRLAPANFQPDDGNPANGVEGTLLTGLGPYSSSESGGALESTYLLDNQTDNNDNGIDENFPQLNGIVSTVITLAYDTEPDGTTDDDLDADVGEGTFGELDRNADMTVDFGVYTPAMSLGNRVFYDYDNNRMLDGADVGVANVIVNLFRDNNQDGIPDSGINNPIATTTTDANGYYIFDGLQPGYYLVQIDENNFRSVTNGVLQDFYSSQDKDAGNNPIPAADNGDDTIENGVDNPFNLANNPDPQARGVFSPTIQLQPSGEVINEDVVGGLGPEGDGQPNIQPSNSDLTVDFGFYQPMSIGNVVWFDTNADGLFNGAEAGIAGVEVYLYRDNGDGVFNAATDTLVPVFDGTTYVNFDTTDARGYYLFDNLTGGQYWVHIPATNFAGAGDPLFNYISTIPNNVPNPGIAPAPNTDSNDNGTPDDTTVTTVGVTSELVTLGIIDPVNSSGLYIPNGSEPINEVNKSNNPPNPANTYDGPASIGRYGETDANSDITIDFGFILADNSSMSIGNRVWFDADRSGLIESNNANLQDEDAAGIDGVTVLLYRANVAGTPIGAPIARDVTANGGYYLFDVLDTDAATGTGDGDGLGGSITPGNYVVAIAPGNFTAGNVLNGYISTTTGVDNPGTALPSTGVEAGYGAINDDNNDNGTANVTYGVLSNLITLALQNERDDEDVTNKEPGVLDGTDSIGNPIAFNNSDLTVDFGFYVPMSLGNRVWVDSNNNGVFNAGEIPVPNGVTLTLYRDNDDSNNFSPGDLPYDDPGNPGNPYQVTTTNGYYLFEDLLPFDDYIVVIDAPNFAGGLLNGYTGSNNSAAFEDNTDTDLNDNGRDAATYDPATQGIPSGIIELTIGGEPTGEQGSSNPADGPNRRGNNGETDANSNLTVDFGVFPSRYYSIGNRIWSDTNNNGVHDPTETGIAAVRVNLYPDTNLDGIPDSLTAIASTTTDANGYYLFDGLPEGNYIVSVAPQNFNTGGALIGYSTTSQANPTDSDPNDDGDSVSDHVTAVIDPNFGILSNTYNLSGTAEPVGEVDPTTAGAVQNPGLDPFGNPIPDNQSNLTVDFGFIRTMSLGNRVWFDINDDGIRNPGELGIAGVDVFLYLDNGATSPGVFNPAEDTPIAIDTTDGNGYYLFNDLQPGNYFINIPNANWTAGAQPLANMQSSTPVVAANDRADNNDNGTPNTVAPANGVTSDLITMAFGTAPTGEADLSNNALDGPNFRGTSNPADNNSDLTRDFGFFLSTPMSIGNRVWFDDGGTTGVANNGILDGDEVGVPNVIVELYADSNGDGVPDTATPIDTVNTDPNGYYLFDGLPPGRYVVVLAEDNWTNGTLDGYLSTTNGTPDNDSQDNGVDNPNPANGGIVSGTIVLTVGGEPSPTAPTDDDEAVTGSGSNGETDDNSNLTVDFGLVVSYDYGDNPDTYGTTNANNGAHHRIISNLYLGAGVDDEGDGQPVATGVSNNTADPGGDGTDEDGMVPPIFISGTTVDVDVTAFNNTGQAATLVGWFDWNGNGTFEAGEGATVNVPAGTNGVVQLTVTIPITAQNDTGGNTYARLRLTTDPITTAEPTGSKNSGEVEDYYIEIRAPGLLINKSDGRNSIVAGTFNTYTITVENSGVARLGVRFFDDIPLATPANATGYDPDTITWNCVATNGASCIANQPAGTGASGGPFAINAANVTIDELIDLPRNGRVVYTIIGRVNEQAGLVPPGGSGPLVNVAQLPNEVPPLEERDETNVIFDPPFGVKSGVALSNTVIRWTMVWYNPGAQQGGITVGDDIVAPQSLPATAAEIDLQCSGGGVGGANTGTCSIVGNRIEWNGTMSTSTPANSDAAVVISFNVIVPGFGNYGNSATISAPGQPPVTVSGNVPIVDPANPDANPIQLQDPTIVKFVNPAFALEGEDVVWTIVVTNPNAGAEVNNVSVTDSVPSEFEIRNTSVNVGTVTVNGQDVTWQIGTLAPLQEVNLTIVTRLRPNLVIDPPVVTNTAFLMTQASASAEVAIVRALPDTGESPFWRSRLLVGGGSGFLVLLLIATMLYIRKSRVYS